MRRHKVYLPTLFSRPGLKNLLSPVAKLEWHFASFPEGKTLDAKLDLFTHLSISSIWFEYMCNIIVHELGNHQIATPDEFYDELQNSKLL